MKIILCFLAFIASAHAEDQRAGTLGIDLGYLIPPSRMRIFTNVPRSQELDDIVRIGARALDWVDILQKDIPESQREQIWRRIDRIGREASPEKPLYYNSDILTHQFDVIVHTTPAAILEILRGTGPLPSRPPEGMTIADVVVRIRAIHKAYSSTSRLLALYGWRSLLDKDSRDFRGWLGLRADLRLLTEMTKRWNALSQGERESFVAQVSAACPLATGDSVWSCRQQRAGLVESSEGGSEALEWMQNIFSRGRAKYSSRFGVRQLHDGARTYVYGKYHGIEVPTYGIEPQVLSWIQSRVSEAWVFPNILGVALFATQERVPGAVEVKWERGALPNVNRVAGDTITMDANTPKWLEHTQTVMRHEMGHVLGFTDCYTEFWDEDLAAFTYYTLDPEDAMCALSGKYLERHRDALLKRYF